MTEDEFKTGKKADGSLVGGSKKLGGGKVALKDWHIFSPPEHDIKIKEGDDLSAVPEMFHQNLITEGVLKG